MTKRTLQDIILELDGILAKCLDHDRAAIELSLVQRWSDLALQVTIAREIALNGICPALSLAQIHAEFRSLELESLHRDIELQLKGGIR